MLVEALLAAGLDQRAYRDLIADIDEIAGDGFGVDIIDWVLELVEIFMSAATPDAIARETFLHRILARIVPIYARLTRLQRARSKHSRSNSIGRCPTRRPMVAEASGRRG